jgi:hypothetical protein
VATVLYRSRARSRHRDGASVVAIALLPPVLDWDDEAGDPSPNFNLQISPQSSVGDVLTGQISATSDFAAVLQTVTHELAEPDLASLAVDVEMTDLTTGTYYVRFRQSRGAIVSNWSNTETIVLAISGLAHLFLLMRAA